MLQQTLMKWSEAWALCTRGKDGKKAETGMEGGSASKNTCCPSLMNRALFSEPRKKKPDVLGVIPALLQQYVWQRQDNHLEALNQLACKIRGRGRSERAPTSASGRRDPAFENCPLIPRCAVCITACAYPAPPTHSTGLCYGLNMACF